MKNKLASHILHGRMCIYTCKETSFFDASDLNRGLESVICVVDQVVCCVSQFVFGPCSILNVCYIPSTSFGC